MAEEKKETTKSKAAKSEVQEVKAERRFCTKCGKELMEGEKCDCSAGTENASNSIDSDAIVNTCKNVWSTIINTFKKPASTIKEEVNSNGTNKSIILMVVLAMTFALYLMAIMSNAVKGVQNAANSMWTFTSSNVNIDVNYLQVFIYGVLIYAIMAIIPIVAALIVAKITKNGNFTFKKAFKLYVTSNAPLVLVYLGMAIILLINVALLNVLGIIASMIIGVACFFNFIFGFNAETKIKDDSRSYAVTGIMALWVIMVIIAFIIVGATLVSSAAESISNQNNYSDMFNW